ncbi:hypothetical protein LIER_29469 [Lithospermum erythrorhizon]|uniref:Uncharacterized protein n=1 Tax=Lithospermum erythrorhizon TaxID=34254 RepID=A0AAV3RMX7_LITER
MSYIRHCHLKCGKSVDLQNAYYSTSLYYKTRKDSSGKKEGAWGTYQSTKLSRKGKSSSCSNCGSSPHNKRTCKLVKIKVIKLPGSTSSQLPTNKEAPQSFKIQTNKANSFDTPTFKIVRGFK